MADPTLSWRVEHACLNAWPALGNVFHDGWVVRFAEGLTRRANSANPLHAEAKISGATIQFLENLFRNRDLPLIIRVPTLLPEVDRTLDRLGFAAEGETIALHGDIDVLTAHPDPAIVIRDVADEVWFKTMNGIHKRTVEQSALYEDIVSSVALPAAFVSLVENGRPVALAFGALDGDLLCVESVVTDTAHRGKGLGRRMMAALFHWAKLNGAAGVCLQVEAHNIAGLALYDGLGLSHELHRYHYRRPPRG